MKMKLIYSKFGQPVCDDMVERLYGLIKSFGISTNMYSTENIFHRVRVGIAEGEIDRQNVVFVLDGKEYSLSSLGRILGCPDSLNMVEGYNERILKAMMREAE